MVFIDSALVAYAASRIASGLRCGAAGHDLYMENYVKDMECGRNYMNSYTTEDCSIIYTKCHNGTAPTFSIRAPAPPFKMTGTFTDAAGYCANSGSGFTYTWETTSNNCVNMPVSYDQVTVPPTDTAGGYVSGDIEVWANNNCLGHTSAINPVCPNQKTVGCTFSSCFNSAGAHIQCNNAHGLCQDST